jgi:DNA-binding transcriptional regulator YiaG
MQQYDDQPSGARSIGRSSRATEKRSQVARARTLDFTECRSQRAALGWSLADLASRSGFSVATISEFEEGRRSLREAALVALQRALRKGLASAKRRSNP